MDEQNNNQTSIDRGMDIKAKNISSFSSEHDTSSDKPKETVSSMANRDIVTRPLLWGLVVFLVFFGLVIGAVSVYRTYQDNNAPIVDQPTSTTQSTPKENINNDNNSINSTPVTSDTSTEANIIESEIKSIDSDLESDVYSDSSLGL